MIDIKERMKDMEFNSMFYWYPKIKDLHIPQPRTEMYEFTKEEFKTIQSCEGIPSSIYEHCKSIAEKMGFPLFMRTDNSSCKHDWKRTCYVPSKEDLQRHIFDLLEYSYMQGDMSYVDKGLAFREFIPLTTKFTAFSGDFPVNKERRYFIIDGKVQCHHPYWYPDAIDGHTGKKNWRPIVNALNHETEFEKKLLTRNAELVGTVVDGYWSVDFAMGKDGRWYLFDMAKGNESFHWLECQYCPEEQREQYKKSVEKPPKVRILDVVEGY